MIPDSITNTLYLADCLPNKYPEFYEKFESLLRRCNISFQLLPKTKDIWAVDYMPIQVSEKKFVQFVYDPDYLKGKVLSKTISNVDHICDLINLNRINSNIVLDGGNVSKTTDKVIMCDKIFQDNLNYSRYDLIKI